MKMIFAIRDDKGAPHVYRIDDSRSRKAIEDLPIEWSDLLERGVLAISVLRWFGIKYNPDPDGGSENVVNFRNVVNQMCNPNGWTISDDFRQWHAPDLVTPVAESGDWQGMDTTRHQDEPEGRDA